MSLRTFFEDPELNATFSAHVGAVPKITVGDLVVAPPAGVRGGQFTLIGTAFEYLTRTFVAAVNPGRVTRRDKRAVQHAAVWPRQRPSAQELVVRVYAEAAAARDKFLDDELFTDDLLRSSVYVADIEIALRSGILHDAVHEPSADVLADLRGLVVTLRTQPWLVASRRAHLNCTFSTWSPRIGGADYDLLIDNVLVDIKTTVKAGWARAAFNNTVACWALSRLEGIEDVTHIGLFSPRYASLMTFEACELFSTPDHEARFLDWFADAATKHGAAQGPDTGIRGRNGR